MGVFDLQINDELFIKIIIIAYDEISANYYKWIKTKKKKHISR